MTIIYGGSVSFVGSVFPKKELRQFCQLGSNDGGYISTGRQFWQFWQYVFLKSVFILPFRSMYPRARKKIDKSLYYLSIRRKDEHIDRIPKIYPLLTEVY